jgi:putative redox protein
MSTEALDSKPKGAPSRVSAKWSGDQSFDVTRSGAPPIRMDGRGKAGPSPVDSLVGAIASCAAIDVVEILAKRRTPVASLDIDAIGHRVDGVPRRLERVELAFTISGEGIEREHAERAISLAVDKYCSVRDSLSRDIPVEWTLELTGGE